MKQPEFIRIEHTLEAAKYYRRSPIMTEFSHKGVHLLPNQQAPYVQRTHNATGIEIEDPSVILMSCSGDVLEDLTVYFNVTRVFQDNNGLPQIEWSLTDVPYDAGYQLVYLEIRQGANTFFYSSPFYLTAEKEERVSRWDYAATDEDTVLSTGLEISFRQPDSFTEGGTYDTISTSRRTTVSKKVIHYERWQSDPIDIFTFGLIHDIFKNQFVYVDFQRTNEFEPFQTPKLTASENFAEAEILLVRDASDVYDPFYVAPIPPDPPIQYTITLNSVGFGSTTSALYDFTSALGLALSFGSVFLYEYSLNQVDWMSIAGDTVSPTAISIPDYQTAGYYYRIRHEATNTISNVVQFVRSLEITNIVASGNSFDTSGNKYAIYWQANGYTPANNILFEISLNGSDWSVAPFGVGMQSPWQIVTPASSSEFTNFRIRDIIAGVTSPTYNFSF